MTGLASMLSNCLKAEKARAELPDSLSSDLILPEKWLLTTLIPFLLLQHSLSTSILTRAATELVSKLEVKDLRTFTVKLQQSDRARDPLPGLPGYPGILLHGWNKVACVWRGAVMLRVLAHPRGQTTP